MSARRDATTALSLAERVRPVLAGNPPDIIGAALADLVAMWIAGHFDTRGAIETAKHREQLIGQWLDTVRQLIEVNEQMIMAKHRG